MSQPGSSVPDTVPTQSDLVEYVDGHTASVRWIREDCARSPVYHSRHCAAWKVGSVMSVLFRWTCWDIDAGDHFSADHCSAEKGILER